MYRNFVLRPLQKINAVLSILGSVWIMCIMLIIVADVAGRTFFQFSLAGTSEIVRNSIVGITFLQMTHVLQNDRHIRTTILLSRLPSPFRKIMYLFACGCGIALFSVLFYSTWGPAWEALFTGEYEGEGVVHIPTFPVRFLIVMGSLFMVLQFLVNIIDLVTDRKKQPEGDYDGVMDP